MTNYAFVDGSVDCTRKRADGGANYGGVCAVGLQGTPVLRQREEELVSEYHFHGYRIAGRLFTREKNDVEVITNNTMELSAVRLAAEMLREQIQAEEEVRIWTDSQYAQGCLRYDTSWSPKENIDLIVRIRDLVARPNVLIHHIRGHRKLVWNELVDLGAKKCVELHATRNGFDGVRAIDVCSQCFHCRHFACKDEDFGHRSTAMRHRYNPPPCNGDSFEALPEKLAEAMQWK